ncbi:MAG: periplasmic heavy metal sensor [Gammaproteobacteria bacterium]|nr:MAG: periplasmic heavy metal sensor [Gammaproteobacteria bacterium]
MRYTRRMTLTATALGVLGATALAWGVNEPPAGEHPPWLGHGRHAHGGRLAHMARQLELSEAQQAQIRAIFEASREQAEQIRSRLESMRDQLGGMVRSGDFYEDQARVLAESHAQDFVELTVLGLRTMSQVYAVLTPEQRARADELLERRRGFGPPRGFGWFGD